MATLLLASTVPEAQAWIAGKLWQPYAEQEGFILFCPSMPIRPDEGGAWFQYDGEAYTWAAIDQVTAQYNINPRYFLVGFSAGAYFVQGFCFDYPESVQAVAVLSSGYFYRPPRWGWNRPFCPEWQPR